MAVLGNLKLRLRAKLVSWFLVASILPLLVAGYLAYQAVNRQAERAAFREVVTTAHSAAKAATEFMNGRCTEILIKARERLITESLAISEMREDASMSLLEEVKLSGAYEFVVLVDARTGRSVAASLSGVNHMDFSKTAVFAGAKGGKLILGGLERNKIVQNINKESDGWTFAIAAPVKTGDKVEGVLIAYLRWQPLENLLTSIPVGQTGQVFAVDKLGRVILHRNRKLYQAEIQGSQMNLGKLWEAVQERKAFTKYELVKPGNAGSESRLLGIAYTGPVGNLPNLEWTVFADAPSNEILLLPNILGTLGVIALVVAALVFVLSIILATRISQPIAAIATVIRKVAAGDLTVATPNISRSDEIGDLVAAFEDLREGFRGQIKRVLQTVNTLAASSAEMVGTAAQVASSSAETSTALTEVSTTVEQVKQSAKIASGKAENVSHDSQESVRVAESGKESTETTIDKINLIRNQMQSISEAVVSLSEHSQQISAIMATVQDIADQSNLLSVNASIEAARAGDYGKGFAVVAQEIKSLADQSKQATEQVRNILEDTQKRVSAVVMAAEQGGKAVELGVAASVQSGEVIGRLSGTVVSSSQAVSVIQASIEQQFVGVEQIATAMSSVDQAMRHIKDSAGQLETAARGLDDLGGELKDSVQHYKL
jgi:methyl-accepting chemotaxis protein